MSRQDVPPPLDLPLILALALTAGTGAGVQVPDVVWCAPSTGVLHVGRVRARAS